MEREHNKVMKMLNELYKQLRKETNPKVLEIVEEIVDLEIEAEKFCNQ